MTSSPTGAAASSSEESTINDPSTFALVNCLSSSDQTALLQQLTDEGFHVIELHGASVIDKPSLLARVQQDLPPVEDLTVHNWDALADHLWNVLYDLPHGRVALVWHDADSLVQHDLQTAFEAVRTFTDVARSVSTGDGGFPRTTTFLQFLLGDGPGYRGLAAPPT